MTWRKGGENDAVASGEVALFWPPCSGLSRHVLRAHCLVIADRRRHKFNPTATRSKSAPNEQSPESPRPARASGWMTCWQGPVHSVPTRLYRQRANRRRMCRWRNEGARTRHNPCSSRMRSSADATSPPPRRSCLIRQRYQRRDRRERSAS